MHTKGIAAAIAASAAILATGGSVALASAPASASTRPPVVYNGMHGWRTNGPPSTIVLQTYRGHWLYYIRGIHWQRSNRGTGELKIKNSGGPGYTDYYGSLHASHIKTHRGVRYYDILNFYAGGNDFNASWHNGRWTTQ
jgi:hypothetical protein